MDKKLVVMTIATGLTLTSGVVAQASTKKASVNPVTPTVKSTYFKGTATKKATIKLSRYKTIYAYGKVTNKGKYTLKLKHKIHAGWKYRVTVAKKGYKTTLKYVKISRSKLTTTTVKQQTPNNSVSTAAITAPTSVNNTNNLNSANKKNNNGSSVKTSNFNQAQYDADYLNFKNLGQQINQLYDEAQTLTAELTPMNNNIKIFKTEEKSSSSLYKYVEVQIQQIQQQIDKYKASNPDNYENSAEYQNLLSDLEEYNTEINNFKKHDSEVDAARSAIGSDFVGYQAKANALVNQINEKINSRNSLVDQTRQLQEKYENVELSGQTNDIFDHIYVYSSKIAL